MKTKEINGAPGYVVTESGEIFNKDGERVPRTKDDKGRYSARLKLGRGKYSNRDIARIVAEAFIPEFAIDPDRWLILFEDGDLSNCSVKNIKLLRRSPAYEKQLGSERR